MPNHLLHPYHTSCCLATSRQLPTAAGVPEASVELADGANTNAFLEQLNTDFPQLMRLLPRCAMAINGNYVQNVVSLTNGDEVAILPPMSGG